MASKEEVDKEVTLDVRGRVAIITLDRQHKLNALTQDHFFRIATHLHEVAEMEDVAVTIVTGKGRFFSAGADVTMARDSGDTPPRKFYNQSLVANNLHNTHAWYSHPKVLITALNGPAVGISASFISHSDFIFAAPHAWLLTPYSSIGLVAEGGASKAFVDRLGISRANEALLMSRKILMPALLSTGFVNQVIEGCGGDPETGKGIDTDKFIQKVLDEVNDKLGDHLVQESLRIIKQQIRAPGMAQMDNAGVREVLGGLHVFMKGVPQKEFAKLASGEKRHKL